MSTKLCIHDLLPTSDPLAMRNLSILSLHCYLPNQHVVNKTHCAARQIWFDSELLRQLFPKLQTLGFKRVYPKGDTPIGFPWFPKKLPYPFGLYRSYYYRHLSYNISQDFNMTRRIFNVERIWKLHPSMFCPMEYVVHDIVIRNCGISFIPEDLFWRIEGLRFLDISFNPITKISSATFVNQTTLSKLYIRKTWIRSFPNGTFDDLRSLNLLVISNNKLQFLQSGLFSHLTRLETLSAHDNEIIHIGHQTLPRWSRELRYVDFRYNRIGTVPFDCHFILNENSICNCDHNNITLANATDILQTFDPVRLNMAKPLAYNGQIPDIAHESNLHEVDFTILSLRNNNVRSVDVLSYFSPNNTSGEHAKSIAAVFSYVKILLGTADFNHVLLCDCALYTLRQFIKYEMDSIVLKYIYNNLVLPNTEQAIDWVCRPYPILQYSNTYFGRFMDMPPEMFICKTESWEFDCPEYCTCYKRNNVNYTIFVDCANRSLVEMPKFSTRLLPSGYDLDVSVANNVIASLPICGALGYGWLSVVTALNVNGNRAGGGDSNSEKFLKCLHNVKKLYLRDTIIEYLPENAIKDMTKNLTELEIPANTMKCCANSSWLKSWLQEFNTTVKEYQNIYCKDKGIPIVQLEAQDFNCEESDYRSTIAGSVLPVLIGLLLAGFAVYWQFEIAVFLYKSFNWHPFHKQEEEQGKKYDAYLMYCDSDYRWAQQTLLVGLENRRYRIVDPLRDSALGRITEEETDEFLRQSHRVIVVVSQRFLRDGKVMSDFYRAETHGQANGNKRYIIMIQMHEGIKFNRHAVFLHYIKTNHFIKVTSRMFWARLFYWLPQLSPPDSEVPLPTDSENMLSTKSE